MKIVSYNVNGLRAALKKNLIEWVKSEDPDIFCIQESKSQEEQVPSEIFEDLGYRAYWHSAVKKGYSGVTTYSKLEATKTVLGMGMSKYDDEGRVLRTDFGDWTLVNLYLPSSSSGEERHKFKMEFLEDFGAWQNKLLKKRKKLIILGDFNIVRLDIDIHNPQRKDKPPGFRPEEREWLQNMFSQDFADAYREVHPDKEDEYSWWSYRAGARKNNKGWRIDYIAVSKALKTKIEKVRHGHEAVHSDHAPIVMEIDL